MSLEQLRPMNVEKLRHFVALDNSRRELEERLEEIKKEMSGLNDELVEEFEQAGIQSTKIDGSTVYIQTMLWASIPDEHKGIAPMIFKELGLGSFVKEAVNTHTLSSYFRELEKDGKEAPNALLGITKLSRESKLRTRKA